MNRPFLVYIGHYGSGKTELAMHEALTAAAQGQKVALVDLDIVNPFFRSGEHRALLEGAGVRLIAPLFVGTGVDIPALPAEVQAVFTGRFDLVVLDVGGDPAGATALGRYHRELVAAKPWVRCVVNTLRPRTTTAEEIVALVREMETTARLPVNALLNNTNLADESTAQALADGEPVVQAAADALGVPLEYNVVRQDLLDEAQRLCRGPVAAVELHTRPIWDA